MDRRWSTFLSLVLIAWMVSSCGPGSPAPATALPPTAAPVEAVGPTRTAGTEPTPVAELPALLGHLHWLGHASFRFDGPPTIYLDPASPGSEKRAADIILISHEHSDHYSPATLKQISKPETVIVTSPQVAAMLEKVEGIAGQVRALQPGERVTVGDVEIEAVAAYNMDKSFHPKTAGGLGFIVTWGGERLYFAGDTSRIPEMADIECDVALLPIDGTYTMDVAEAAQAAADIGPKVAVPMHMRSADPEQFRSFCACRVVIMEVEP